MKGTWLFSRKAAHYFLFSFLFSNLAFAMTAKEIMEKSENAKITKDLSSKAKIVTGGGGKPERVKEFDWWRKLSADGIHFKILTKFLSPAEVKNEGILFLEGKGDQTEILIYLPSYKKIRRVETGQQSGSFMGSEFSYADITNQHTEDYDYKLLREEKCGDNDCYVIEYVPNSDVVLDKIGSPKGTLWIRKDNFMNVHTEILDLEKKLWKKLEAKEIKMVDPANKKWFTHYLKMENIKTNRFTIFTFSDVKVNQGLSDSIFNQQNLSKEK
jgi:outer membrane lipoprotein-sorting protein